MTKAIKQTILALFAVLLFVSCAFMFSACGKDDNKSSKDNTSTTDVQLTNEQCATACTAVSTMLKEQYNKGASSESSSETKTADTLSLVPDSKLGNIDTVDYSGVGRFLAFGISSAAFDSSVLVCRGEYARNTVVEGDIKVINDTSAKAKLTIVGLNSIIKGECVVTVMGEKSYAYYVNYSVRYDFTKGSLEEYELYVFDNNAESRGELLYVVNYDKTKGMRGYIESSATNDNNPQTSITTTAKTSASTFYAKTAVKSDYDFTECFERYLSSTSSSQAVA